MTEKDNKSPNIKQKDFIVRVLYARKELMTGLRQTSKREKKCFKFICKTGPNISKNGNLSL